MHRPSCIGLLAVLLIAGCGRRAAEWNLGWDEITGPLPFVSVEPLLLRAATADDERPALEVVPGRERFWAADGHLEILVLLEPPAGVELEQTTLEIEFAAQQEWEGGAFAPPPAQRFAFYPRIPRGFSGAAAVRARWLGPEGEIAAVVQEFRVELPGDPPAMSGRIPIRIDNEPGAHANDLPFSAGIPFPRGVLPDASRLRLVDETGAPRAAEFTPLGHWSKFGSVKWVRCDFTASLAGGPRELFVEYGPQVRNRPGGRKISARVDGKSPRVDAGRVLVEDGIWFAPEGAGSPVKLLDATALRGGFVEHENGTSFRIAPAAPFEIEEQGSERVVLRGQGWYVDANGAEFCRYEVRWIFYRNSPVARIFHTWIFTGDSDVDRIRNMGWRFGLENPPSHAGFLDQFGPDAHWLTGERLLQYRHNEFEVATNGRIEQHPGGRAPGVAHVAEDAVGVFLGVRDFWQAFPSELELHAGALWFHSWPRHGKPRIAVDFDAPVLLQFAHSGEVLDLRLPDEYTIDPIDITHCGPQELERIWARGEPSSVNAQGVARTEEMWLYFASGADTRDHAARVLEGLNQETIRAVVDPAWTIGSGVFFESHPRDATAFPEFEAAFEASMLYEPNLVEKLGLYGMWLHGERLWDWNNPRNLYRALRKGHGGYGALSWMPYARSGNPALLRRQDAALRRMLDANFRHHVSEEVARKAVGDGSVDRRVPGFWICGALPWAAQRNPAILDMHVQPHQFWSGWFVNGYHRARDMAAETYPALARQDAENIEYPHGNRAAENVLKSMIDTYEGTHDPWFLLWAHAVAGFQRQAWWQGRWQPFGRFWSPGEREFHRFTGNREHARYLLEFTRESGGQNPGALAYASRISDDDWFLRRTSAMYWETADVGFEFSTPTSPPADLPMLLGALATADPMPAPLNSPFVLRREAFEEGEPRIFRTPTVVFQKEAGRELPLFLGLIRLQTYEKEEETRRYWIHGPDGQLLLEGEFSVGTFDNRPGIEVVLPADAPEGEYRFVAEILSRDPQSHQAFGHLRGVYLPLTPAGTPEVFLLEGERMPQASRGSVHFTPVYYFLVPEGIETLEVRAISSRNGAAIRDNAGNLMWSQPGSERGQGFSAEASIPVPAGQDGRLWSIRAAAFTMDPRVPPVYAMDPDRWFLPAKD